MYPRDIRVNSPLEALVVEQALAMVREMKRVADAAPDGQVLAQAESVAVTEGRTLTRKSLEAVLNDQAEEVEKKGRPAEPARAAGRGTIAARGRARSSRRPAR
jgi:vancomycin resistance protein YoaR